MANKTSRRLTKGQRALRKSAQNYLAQLMGRRPEEFEDIEIRQDGPATQFNVSGAVVVDFEGTEITIQARVRNTAPVDEPAVWIHDRAEVVESDAYQALVLAEARELYTHLGFQLKDQLHKIQEIDDDGYQVETWIDDRDDCGTAVFDAYMAHRDEWLLEEAKAAAGESATNRAKAWAKIGVEVVAEAEYRSWSMHQRVVSTITTVLKGGEKLEGDLILPETADSIVFVVTHTSDLDSWKFSVVDPEALPAASS